MFSPRFPFGQATRARHVHNRNVRDLLKKTFDLSEEKLLEQDRVWNDWLELKNQESRDLKNLLTSQAGDTFKARAIAVMIAPSVQYTPFGWPEKHEVLENISFAALSPKLLDFTLVLLEMNIILALENPEIFSRLDFYNRLILGALARLDEYDPRARKFFDRYEINDPIVFSDMDNSSGYTPILELFHAEVPEKWKRLAHEKMCRVIRAEQEGRTKPRCEHENALRCYVSHIRFSSFGGTSHYSSNLLATQIDFIIGLPKISGLQLFRPDEAKRVLEKLAEKEYRFLRRDFAVHMVFNNRGQHGEYIAHSEETLEGAKMMLLEFGESDPFLGDRLKEIIRDGLERQRERELATQTRLARVNVVMSAMQ